MHPIKSSFSLAAIAAACVLAVATPGLGQQPTQPTMPAPKAAATKAATAAAPKAASGVTVASKRPVAKVATATPAADPAAAPAKTAAAAKKCMRLPLSDIAFGEKETIAQASMRLGEYADAEAKRRGWKGPLAKSLQTASCEVYLVLPLLGTEYKCLVTATFCTP